MRCASKWPKISFEDEKNDFFDTPQRRSRTRKKSCKSWLVGSYLEFPKREFPRSGIVGIPNSHWNSQLENGPLLGIPWNSHTEGVLCIQRGFFCIQRGCFGGVSYQDIAKFLIHRALVVGATAIRASPAFEEHRNKGTAYDPSLKSPIDII